MPSLAPTTTTHTQIYVNLHTLHTVAPGVQRVHAQGHAHDAQQQQQQACHQRRSATTELLHDFKKPPPPNPPPSTHLSNVPSPEKGAGKIYNTEIYIIHGNLLGNLHSDLE